MEEDKISMEMYQKAKRDLEHRAWRVINMVGKDSSEFMMVCIENCPRWRELVAKFPGKTVQRVESASRGQKGFVYAAMSWKFSNLLIKVEPKKKDLWLAKPAEGRVKVVALSQTGYMVTTLTPKPILEKLT